jgi:hypothetical protein
MSGVIENKLAVNNVCVMRSYNGLLFEEKSKNMEMGKTTKKSFVFIIEE